MSEIDFEALNKIKKPEGSRSAKFRLAKFGLSSVALLLLSMEMVDDATGLTSLRGKQGLWDFSRKLNMGKYDLSEVVKSLETNLLLRREGDQYYITPKGRRKAHLLRLHAPAKMPDKWDEKWYLVIFDIPEDLRSKRNILRSILKRKGFVKLQNSVFVAPYADFEELDLVRREYEIEKYVNFLIAESADTDDDLLLRNKFSLGPKEKNMKIKKREKGKSEK